MINLPGVLENIKKTQPPINGHEKMLFLWQTCYKYANVTNSEYVD